MFIKQIVLDGFKSYATRTVIPGWDPNFNAITGLNGSGKSNILDSICFVLGISNLSQVRVNNLQELVYKQGQARVTKASVTIIFDNADKKNSPVGYEQYAEITVTRQVVIGGRNKYLINGHTAQLNRVQNLFHSVQLNINNPHFLIMQGRITKVLNMKPPEILSMVEEAAGTSLYEVKKKSAERTILRKQIKLDQIDRSLREEITPQLDKLRKERSHFMIWSTNNTEIERLTRFYTAFRYTRALITLQGGEVHRDELNSRLIQYESEQTELAKEVEEITGDVEQMMIEKEGAISGKCKDLEVKVNELSKSAVKFTAKFENSKDNFEEEKKTLSEHESSIDSLKARLVEKQKESVECSAAFEGLQAERAKLKDAVDSLQAQQLGFAVSDQDDEKAKGSLAEQLMQAQQTAAECESTAKTLKMRADHIRKRIHQKQKQANGAADMQKNAMCEIDAKRRELVQLEKKVKALNLDPERESQLQETVHRAEDAVGRLRERVEHLRANMSRVNFDYSAPSRDFDHRSVKGLVAKLIHVKDNKFATALEIAAGGRLYQVVVDTQETAKLLFKRGQMKKRVTMIPLNKISARVLDRRVIKNAENLVGRDNVSLALTLVGYDAELEKAMQFVFGQTLICPDMNMAKSVTFNKNVRARTVTYEGDSFSPAGTLTGGSRNQQGSLLTRITELREAEVEWERESKQLEKLSSELSRLSRSSSQAQALLSRVDLARHEVHVLEERMEQTVFAQLQKEIGEHESELKGFEEKMEVNATNLDESQKSADDLKRSLDDFEQEKERKSQQVEQEIKNNKKELSKMEKKVKKHQQAVEKVELEAQRLQEEIQSVTEQRDGSKAQLEILEKEVADAQKELARVKSEFDAATIELESERARVVECDRKISARSKELTEFRARLEDKQLQLKRLQHEITRWNKEEADAKRNIEHLEEKNPWIENEKALFGKENTDYDFAAMKPLQAEARLTQLREEQVALSEKINKKVLSMFEKAEQEYSNLVKKRRIVLNDKKKIQNVIKELDQKKNETLQATWEKVNKDFGAIFSSVLPGAKAKLSAPEGKSILDGLEVCVAFGNVWKDSLTELSGGQRSLLALSLILSLLLFKPAPMYILDEIDAALDLSHTQNIGRMLKTHFAHSQFIVVSLKEGMFHNANVIFRTRFVDGVSVVTRSVKTH
eukprot:72962_1